MNTYKCIQKCTSNSIRCVHACMVIHTQNWSLHCYQKTDERALQYFLTPVFMTNNLIGMPTERY